MCSLFTGAAQAQTAASLRDLLDRCLPHASPRLPTGCALVAARLLVSDRIAAILTADNLTIATAGCGYIALSSDNPAPANRTFLLTTGATGQSLVLEWVGTNAGVLLDDSPNSDAGNVRLSSDWIPTQYDTLSLRFNGTDWIETSRSAN